MFNTIYKNFQLIYSNYRLSLKKNWNIIVWLIIITAAIFVVILGSIGFQKNLLISDPSKEYPLSSYIFMAFQLFSLQSGAQPSPIGWELETARWLSMFVSGSALIQAFLMGFEQKFQTWRCRYKSNHNLIIGFGLKGKYIFNDLINKGQIVIVVDKSFQESDFLQIKLMGGFSITLNASNKEICNLTAAPKAANIFITCGSDILNIQIAQTMLENLIKHKKTHHVISFFINCNDKNLFDYLQINNLKNTDFNFNTFNPESNTARVLLTKYPFDYKFISPGSENVVNFVVFGCSPQSEAFIIQLARIGHYSNLKSPVVTIIDPRASIWKNELFFKYENLNLIIDFEVYDVEQISFKSKEIIRDIEKSKNKIKSFFIFNDNEKKCLLLALEIKKLFLKETELPIFLNVSNPAIINFFTSNEIQSNIIPTNTLGVGCKTNEIISDEFDLIAKKIHEDYLKNSFSKGQSINSKPALKLWVDLNESYRQMNRDQADHIFVKLRAINCRMVPMNSSKNETVTSFTKSEIEILAQMEHKRWCANRWIEGFVYGSRDDILKTHNNLVPWENLSEDVKDYDREPIVNILNLAKMINMKITRD